jgi:hypothetical protein
MNNSTVRFFSLHKTGMSVANKQTNKQTNNCFIADFGFDFFDACVA